jgi:glutamine amidotransferase/cyclase
MARPLVHLLDYGAGNVRSVRNAIERAGFSVADVTSPAQLAPGGGVRVLVFPGVGAFASAVDFLDDPERGFRVALLAYARSGRALMGICLGMQLLFERSEEAPGRAGLGLIPGVVARFAPPPAGAGADAFFAVPHMGWNGLRVHGGGEGGEGGGAPASAAPGRDTGAPRELAELARADAKLYFVHSFRAVPSAENAAWVLATTDYGGQRFVSAVQRGNVFATQCHPEKSGQAGLRIFTAFLAHAVRAADAADAAALAAAAAVAAAPNVADAGALARILDRARAPPTRVCRRIVACLDVRSNDEGDLVVTKGDQYDVREKAVVAAPAGDGTAAAAAAASAGVRNLGKPVELCERYYAEGADEVCFLNITAFRELALEESPMMAVLRAASERVFVPLTVGGGIRDVVDGAGVAYSALEVAGRYFRAGADKVSIGSEAVLAAEALLARGGAPDGSTGIEAIARVYGSQAVVVSIDPRRVYVLPGEEASAAEAAGHVLVEAMSPGPRGEARCWYQCTVRGGREGRPICAVRLAEACEKLGAGELLVNCVDCDGQKGGFDEPLLAAVCARVRIPVVASSGAGAPAHFGSVFAHTRVEAALAAGIFHRREVAIADVKEHLRAGGVEVRQ